jgi:hypothetical protein
MLDMSTSANVCFVNQCTTTNHSLVQVMTVPDEDDSNRVDSINAISLNLTVSNETASMQPNGSLECELISTPAKAILSSLLSREYTYNTPETRSSQQQRSTLNPVSSLTVDQQTTMPAVEQNSSSTSIVNDQAMSREIEQNTTSTITVKDTNEPRTSTVHSTSLLGVLLTQTTDIDSSKAITDELSPRKTRRSERVSTPSIAKMSINPLHSSTPTSKRCTLQMVSIGEEEQVSITVPQLPSDNNNEHQSIDRLNMSIIPLSSSTLEQSARTMEIGIQTTPSLDRQVEHRQWNTIEQQTTPRTSTTRALLVEHQTTPIQAKAIIRLQRNVRFQLTPTTDARLTEKEKRDEHLRGSKPEITFPLAIIPNTVVTQDKVRPKTKKKRLTVRKQSDSVSSFIVCL